MEQTEIQKLIEKNVTNGLVYDSRTSFIGEDFGLQEIVNDSCKKYYKNTKEGLQRHLRHLNRITNPSLRYSPLLIAGVMAMMMSGLIMGHPDPNKKEYKSNLGIDNFYI